MSQFKENMTNMIVHDLKNPLSTILNVDAIEEKAESNKMVQQSGYRMLNLVENILSVYKYEDTKMELEKEKVSLNDILDNSIKEVKYLAEKKILTLSIAEELNSCVNLDKDIIRRVFVNILTNAIKFSPIDNQICINAIIDRTTIIISIVNQGIPIPKAYHKVIFEPFKQIKKKSSGKIQSTGLGLAFCKMAIEAHGGELGVNSDEVNGTEFWFSLPESFVSKGKKELVEKTNEILSKEEIKYLKPFAVKLDTIEIYEISAIANVLLNIDKNTKSIQNWISHIEEAAYQDDINKYKKLLKL